MPAALYREVYGKYVPRACVDVIVYDSTRGAVLVERTEVPIGWWHIPGGSIQKGECFFDAAVRHGLKDLGLKVEPLEVVGAIENFIPMEIEDEPVFMHNIMVEVLARTDVFELPAGAKRCVSAPALGDKSQFEFLLSRKYLR